MGRAEPYRGQASDVCYSQSPWFNADEIPADAWDGYVVQIEEVRARRGVRFNKGRARDVELFLKFAGIEKELRVNVTIRRSLDALIGPMCADWFGKWITLYVQGGIDTNEGKKNGVRVRPSLPPQRAPSGQAPTVSEAERDGSPQSDPAPVATAAEPWAEPERPAAPEWTKEAALADLARFVKTHPQRVKTALAETHLDTVVRKPSDIGGLNEESVRRLHEAVIAAAL